MIDSNSVSKLEQIKQLLDSKVITESEYKLLKQEILFKKDSTDEIKKNVSVPPKSSVENFVGSKKINSAKPEKNSGSNAYVAVVVFFLFLFFGIWNSKESHTDSNSNASNDTVSSAIESSNDSSNNSATTCKICGRNFYGDGYDKIDGIWQRNTSMQTELCSPSCAMKEEKNIDEKYDNILRKYGYNTSESSSMQDAPIQHYGEHHVGSDGRIYENSSCSLCRGTGIESGRNIATGELEQRVCPMCEGRGVQSY